MIDKVRELIETQVNTGWAALIPMQFGNINFVRPSNSAWCRLNVLFGGSEQKSIGPSGGRIERHTGLVVCQFFVPVGTGTKALLGYADTFGALLRMQQLTGSGVEVTLRTPYISSMSTESEWHSQSCTVPFQADKLF